MASRTIGSPVLRYLMVRRLYAMHRRRLAVASERVRNESMRVNGEFDTIEYGGKAR